MIEIFEEVAGQSVVLSATFDDIDVGFAELTFNKTGGYKSMRHTICHYKHIIKISKEIILLNWRKYLFFFKL